jgi:hypothetical protein
MLCKGRYGAQDLCVLVPLLIRTVNFCVKVLMSTLTYRFTVCINRMARNKLDLSSNRFGLAEDLWLMILFNIISLRLVWSHT